MRRVTKFEAEDGTIHDTEDAANVHDKRSKLKKWYERNELHGRYECCRIDWADFIEWCTDHQDKLKEILNSCRLHRIIEGPAEYNEKPWWRAKYGWWWCKYGYWCPATFRQAVGYFVRGGQIRFGRR